MPHYFVTGATGFIGSELIKELLANGHQVTGLARSDASAELLVAEGVNVIRGDLENLDALKQGAKDYDGVIHLAFNSDFTDYDQSAKTEQVAVKAMLKVLEGSNKPFVGISGLVFFQGIQPDSGIYYTENIRIPDGTAIRIDTENIILAFGSRGVRSSVVRLPTVHGLDDKRFIPSLIKYSVDIGSAFYFDEGSNYLAAVHVKDAAVVLRLAAEKGRGIYHAVAENLTGKQIATKIGEKTHLPVVSLPISDAFAKFGFIGFLFASNGPSRSDKTQKDLGWKPVHATLAEVIDAI